LSLREEAAVVIDGGFFYGCVVMAMWETAA
jgi:hypothetical protein